MGEVEEKQKDFMEKLREGTREIMRTLIDDKGFQFPMRFAFFDSLESFFAGRFESADGTHANKVTLLAVYSPKGMIVDPINFFFVDALNRVEVFKIDLGTTQQPSA